VRLKNKIAIVTGAGRGIGKAISIEYAKEGADLLLISRTEKELEETAREITLLGQKSSIFVCDVSKEDQVKNSIDYALSEFKNVDILVNNAGLGGFRPIWGTRLNNWNRMLEVNLTSNFLFTKHVWKSMKSNGGGSIINVSSLSGTRAYPMYASYSSSKWGQIGFTKTAAEEGKPDNIRVNAIAPGKVDTPMRENVDEDKSRILKSEDCVGATIFFGSEESRYITGQVIEIEWFGPSP
jgi:3-oxoacyl-[acyl-carrier protein] reductase